MHIFTYTGIPYVTLPVEYLKGRMGYAFLRTLNLPQLVAHNITHYIDISINLSKNITLYNTVTNIICHNSDLLWEDMSYIHGWIQVLNTISGLPYLSWEHFISTTNRNLTIETKLRDQRGHNSDLFDEIWGNEYYLLDSYGIARLETHLSTGQRPRVFNNWVSQVSQQDYDGGSRKCPPNNNNGSSNSTDTNNTNISGLGHASSSSWSNRLMLGQRGDAAEIAYRAQCYCLDDGDVDEFSHYTNTSVDYVKAAASSASDPASPSLSTDTSTVPTDSLISPTPSSPTNDQNSDADDDVIVTGLLTDLRDLVYSNQFDLAYNHAVSFLQHHLPKHQNNIYILMDLAAIQYHRGEYQVSYDISKYIVSIVPTHYLAYGCLGVSAVYLGWVDDAIHAYHTAYMLLTSSNTNDSDSVSGRDNNSMNTSSSRKYTSMIFSLTIEAIQFNLVTALYAFKRYKECIYYAIKWMFPSPLPNSPSTTSNHNPLFNTSDVAASDVAVSVSFGQAAVITLSTVQWSEARYNDIAVYESKLREKGLYGTTTTTSNSTNNSNNNTLVNEIIRVHTQYNHILNAVVDSLMHILTPQDRINIMTDLTHLIELADVAVPGIDKRDFSEKMYTLQIQSITNTTIRHIYKQKGIVLISQYYTSTDIQTQYDMNNALINNLLNPYITEIHLLLEEGEKKTDTTQNYDLYFSTLPHYFKIKMFRLGHRMTFADAFEYANRELIGRTVILGMYMYACYV